MTPAPVARFMASLYPPCALTTCTLLDAGAGVGALTCAFLDRWVASDAFRLSPAASPCCRQNMMLQVG
jgi:predicted RNA methylase